MNETTTMSENNEILVTNEDVNKNIYKNVSQNISQNVGQSINDNQKVNTSIIYFIGGFIFISAILLYLGIFISKNIEDSTKYLIFWFIYIITIVTIANSLFNYYTLATISKKSGIPGDQGLPGEEGDKGDDGECEKDCKLKTYSNVVMQKLDNAYNTILEKSIGNKIEPSKKIKNTYIKNLVIRICDSKQFKQVAQLRHPTDLLSYVSEILTKWLQIIANADGSENKKHFQEYMEIYGEHREWEAMVTSDNNPFQEIEKYDIFYWGLDKEFQPIKLQSCLKQSVKKTAPIKAFKTNVYTRVMDDRGTGADRDYSAWITKPMTIDGDIYYPLGLVGMQQNSKTIKSGGRFIEKLGGSNPKRYNLPGKQFDGPTKTNIIVSADSKWIRKPHPDKWSWKWNAKRKKSSLLRRNSGKDQTWWNAEDFYEDGELYRCFGSMIYPDEPPISNKYNPSRMLGRDNVNMVCINDKALEKVNFKHYSLWDDGGSGRKYDGSIFSNEDGLYNLIYFQSGYTQDNNRKMYRIKPEFLDEVTLNENPFTSNNEKDTGYAVGFQEVKYQKNRDGSLFNLLDLVVKAPLVGLFNNKKLFLEHSGLNNPNSYFIREFDETSFQPNKCLKLNGAQIKGVECNPTQNQQLWSVEFIEQSSEICLVKSVETGKYLYSNSPKKFGVSGDISSRNINDKYLRPYLWKIEKDKTL
jgi:hypothetical protein